MKLKYQTGFGNEFATEAVEGALPVGRNSPQKAPLGLYAEQFSGTALQFRVGLTDAHGHIAFAQAFFTNRSGRSRTNYSDRRPLTRLLRHRTSFDGTRCRSRPSRR